MFGFFLILAITNKGALGKGLVQVRWAWHSHRHGIPTGVAAGGLCPGRGLDCHAHLCSGVGEALRGWGHRAVHTQGSSVGGGHVPRWASLTQADTGKNHSPCSTYRRGTWTLEKRNWPAAWTTTKPRPGHASFLSGAPGTTWIPPWRTIILWSSWVMNRLN